MVAPLAWGTAALGVVAGGAVTVIAPAPSVTTASLHLPGPATAISADLVTVEPVATEPRLVDATDLVKSVRRAEERARGAAAQAPRVATPADCGLSTSGLGAVQPHVRAAARFLGCRFGEPTMYGLAGRAGASDHPAGLAVDFMVDRATGDALADCALHNRAALDITYVIWRQRINFGDGWQPMADRGGVTANHYDHVHVSFGSPAGRAPTAC